LNVKKPFFFILFALIAGFVFGLFIGTYSARSFFERSGSGELRARFEQVNRDLGTAVDSQREAAERASRLQAELRLLTEHARDLEMGIRRLEAGVGNFETRTGNLEARTGILAAQLDLIVDESGELADGIIRAQDSLEESRILLDELGIVLRSLP